MALPITVHTAVGAAGGPSVRPMNLTRPARSRAPAVDASGMAASSFDSALAACPAKGVRRNGTSASATATASSAVKFSGGRLAPLSRAYPPRRPVCA